MDAATIASYPGSLGPPADRVRPALELATAVGLLELELWHLRAHGPAWLNVFLYAVIIGTILLSDRRRRAAQGVEPGPVVGRARAWGESIGACLILSTILMAAAALVGDSNETFEFVFLAKPPLKLASWLVGKFLAALAQQLALQMFLWPVCSELTRGRTSGAILASSIFGLIHLPSPTLVAITLLAGLVWIGLFARSGRLAPLVLSHMILATLAHGGLPERLTYDMRVGLTATADLKRFSELSDPRIRLINRRLKESRADLKRYASDEYFRAQGGTNPDLVRSLYRDILGRPASEAEVAGWLGRGLKDPRDQMPSILLASDEYAALKARRQAGAVRR